MRLYVFIALILPTIVLADWTYRTNQATRELISQIADVQSEIIVRREELGRLRAEWAYLNRPDRVTVLTAQHFDELGLVPITHSVFGRMSAIPFLKEKEVEEEILDSEESPELNVASNEAGWSPSDVTSR